MTYSPVLYLAPEHPSQPIYPTVKRAIDVLAAAALLLLLSPLFLLVALLIKLESRGPVFYTAQRVGQGYRIFGFYKFRSMRTDADRMLAQMKNQNQYAAAENVRPDSQPGLKSVETHAESDFLVGDEGLVHAEKWLDEQRADEARAFVKIKNDPRITRVGQFIRNTSMDELPQLLNVLKGDMSLVGNRPLPLYEAEKLTADGCVGRFLAPAGITGLWQVTERGKANAAPDSRKNLDIRYAETYSFGLDLKILFKTPLALFQSENV